MANAAGAAAGLRIALICGASLILVARALPLFLVICASNDSHQRGRDVTFKVSYETRFAASAACAC